MARKARKKAAETMELDVTSFMNLMVVLIPFLLATAVFSQVSIQELNLPTPGAGGAIADTPPVVIEVVVRKEALEIGDGKTIRYRLPVEDGEYDFQELSRTLLDMKLANPDKEDITVLLEPDIRYNDMIATMDAVRLYRAPATEGDDNGQTGHADQLLFPDIAIGDAP
ncbi:ExbD/TolR family protein [Isoalcanivorax indicus]|uniref:ExbD/TolR family protein n=1 Tax=Isoalcanivorax indicus TaxID=2202653 RepID=UPI000DBA4CA3|nr:biopolymer transporter ExbD [Isoalcanivorax indicus]